MKCETVSIQYTSSERLRASNIAMIDILTLYVYTVWCKRVRARVEFNFLKFRSCSAQPPYYSNVTMSRTELNSKKWGERDRCKYAPCGPFNALSLVRGREDLSWKTNSPASTSGFSSQSRNGRPPPETAPMSFDRVKCTHICTD